MVLQEPWDPEAHAKDKYFPIIFHKKGIWNMQWPMSSKVFPFVVDQSLKNSLSKTINPDKWIPIIQQ